MEVQVTKDNFEQEIVKSELPVLVDFWAPWCGPCLAIAPHVEEVAKELAGKVKVAKVNVDESPDIAAQYSVMSIPTLIVIKEGKVMEKSIGAMEKDQIIKFLSSYLT